MYFWITVWDGSEEGDYDHCREITQYNNYSEELIGHFIPFKIRRKYEETCTG